VTGGSLRPFAKASALADRLRPYTPLVLRLAVGLIFLHHGVMKVGMGVGGVTGFLGGVGFPFPGFWAVVLIALETVGAACVAVGLLTRLWAALIAVEMVLAIFLVAVPAGRSAEFEVMLLAGAIALVGLGDGPLALGPLFRKRAP
jgi:putative oxidoreductase